MLPRLPSSPLPSRAVCGEGEGKETAQRTQGRDCRSSCRHPLSSRPQAPAVAVLPSPKPRRLRRGRGERDRVADSGVRPPFVVPPSTVFTSSGSRGCRPPLSQAAPSAARERGKRPRSGLRGEAVVRRSPHFNPARPQLMRPVLTRVLIVVVYRAPDGEHLDVTNATIGGHYPRPARGDALPVAQVVA